MATPRCPYCNTQGLKHLAAHHAGYYAVIYCNQCGAIHGVVPALQKPTPHQKEQTALSDEQKKQSSTTPKKTPVKKFPEVVRTFDAPELPFQHPALPQEDLVRVVSDFTGEDVKLTPNQLQHVYRNVTSDDYHIPRCPEHTQEMIKITLPPGVKYAGQQIWVCPHYSQCRQWQIDDGKTLPSKPSEFIAKLGNSDLSKKIPYSPQRMAAMVKAANLGRGQNTFYRKIAISDGPPFCPDHKIEMEQFTIPQGYRNQETEVWICPQFNCEKWELVDK